MAFDAGGAEVRLSASLEGLVNALEEAKGAVRETMGDIGRQKAEPKVDLDIKQVVRKQAQIESEMKKIARMRAEAEADLDKTLFDARAAELQAELEALDKQKVEVTVDVDRSKLGSAGRELRKLAGDIEAGDGKLRQWLRSIGKFRVQMGPVSGTLRQFGVGFTLLSPLISQLIGGLSALIGFVGSGLVGAFTVGTSAAAGFGTALLGTIFIVKPLIAQLGAATKASTAYHDAVVKYGRGSSQAQDKLDQLRQTLKGIDPEARKAIVDFGQLKDTWNRLTAPAASAFWDTVAEGIKTARSLLPTFARQSTMTFRTLAQGVQGWLQQMRSADARNTLTEIMQNFRAALPSVLHGLGQIGAALGHLAAAGSRWLPQMGRAFDDWATSLNEATHNTVGFQAGVNRVVQDAGDLFNLLGHSGSLLVHFFGAGIGAGRNLSNTLDGLVVKWDRWVQSAQGQQSLEEFFGRSAETTKEFFSVLGSLVQLLYQLGRATAPFADGLLKIATALGDVVTWLSQLSGFGSIIRAIGSAWATWFVVTKIGTAIIAVTRALGILVAERAAVTAFAVSLEAALGPLAAIAAVSVGVGVALNGLLGNTDDASEAIARFNNNVDNAVAGLQALNDLDLQTAQAGLALIQAQQAHAQTQAALNKLKAKGLQGTQAYKQALAAERSAALGVVAAHRSYEHSQRQSINTARKVVAARRDVVAQDKEEGAAASVLAAHQADLARAQDRLHLTQLNNVRSAKGLKPIVAGLSRAYGDLRRAVGDKLTLRVATVGDRQASAQIARLATSASRLGSRDEVVRVLTKSEGTQATIRDLKKVEDAAYRKLPNGVVVRVRDDGVQTVQRDFTTLAGFRIPDKTARVRGDASGALSAWQSVANLPNEIIKYLTIITQHKGATGGAFAGGGDAAAVANTRQNRSQRVTRPTILTGEENRPEYVIATNPAYRASNIAYLGAAASALGYAIMPALKKGGASAHLYHSPQYDFWHGRINQLEGRYQNIYDAETQDISAGRRRDYDYDKLLGIKHDELDAYGSLAKVIRALVGNKFKDIRHSQKAKHELPGEINDLQRKLQHANKEFNKTDPKNRDRRKALADRINGLEKRISHKGTRLGEAKSAIPNDRSEIGQLLRELRQEIPNEKQGVQNDIQTLLDAQKGLVPLGGASSTPSIGAQLTSLDQSRYDLFSSMGGNFSPIARVFGQAAAALGPSPAAAAGSVPGPAGKAVAGAHGASGGGKTVTQHITFTGAPKDPHTLSQYLAWEAAAA